MSGISKKVWVTLLTNANYLAGALVLDYTLKSVHSKYALVIMVTPDVSAEARGVLAHRGIRMREVDGLVIPSSNLAFESFVDVWTKLRVFELTEYDRVVLLDSDMIVRKNMDELLEMHLEDGWIAAAHVCACNPMKIPTYPPDWIPANCAYTNPQQPAPIEKDSPRTYSLLNSGTVVLAPSITSFETIKQYLAQAPLIQTYKFPDQDLLADVFRGKWKPLSWHYNALKTLRNIHSNVWKDHEVRCLHYILSDKPWSAQPTALGEGGLFEVVNRWWWDEFGGLEGDMANVDDIKRAREDWEIVLATIARA